MDINGLTSYHVQPGFCGSYFLYLAPPFWAPTFQWTNRTWTRKRPSRIPDPKVINGLGGKSAGNHGSSIFFQGKPTGINFPIFSWHILRFSADFPMKHGRFLVFFPMKHWDHHPWCQDENLLRSDRQSFRNTTPLVIIYRVHTHIYTYIHMYICIWM